jgi:predicted transcriptional regulator
MNIQLEKIELAKMLLSTDNEIILKKIKAILKGKETDCWDEASDEEKAAIEKGIAQLEKGEGISHEKVMKKYKK